MYQALYRKWRPQTFDEVVGQQHITETLKNQVKSGRLSHAYIFIGTRGTGKTTCARILAKAVNCENPVNGNPCCKCAACRGISEGSVMDVVELDAASNNGVDNVRALREEAIFSPAAVKKRVYIIDEVHMLSTAAFNALLKILEEPPEHLMFILATTELNKVPATILSRCQRHSFKRLDTPTIAEYLEYIAKQEQFSLQHDAAELIARLAEGGVRDALSLLDQCSANENIDVDAVYSTMGLAGNRRIQLLLDSILKQDTPAVLDMFQSMWIDGKDPATLMGELSVLLRDVLMLHVAPKGGMSLLSGGYDISTLTGFAKRMTSDELIYALGTIQNAAASMRDAKSPKTAAELCLISLCDNTAGESIHALKARISRLEETVKNGVLPTRQAAEPAVVHHSPARVDEALTQSEPPLPRQAENEATYEIDTSRPSAEQPEDTAEITDGDQTDHVAPAPISGDIWKAVRDEVSQTLPIGVRMCLDDPLQVCGDIDGDVFMLRVIPGFMYNQFNKQDILNMFSDAVHKVTGRQMRVKISELTASDNKNSRDIEELRKFKETRFI